MAVVLEQGHGRQRGTQHHAGMETRGFRKGFVFAHDALARQRRYHVHAFLPGLLAHVGDLRVLGFERHALLQFPAQDGERFLRLAGKLFEMLDKNADHGIRQQQRHIHIPGAEAAEDAAHGRAHRAGIDDIGLDGGGHDGSRREGLHGEAVHAARAREARRGNLSRGDLAGQRRVRAGVQPAHEVAYQAALEDALPEIRGATQRRSPC
jgi:hypothetical protein